MFGHNNVTDHHEAVALPSLFEHGEEAVAAARGTKQRQAAVAGTRDKVQMMSALVTMQSARHDKLSLPAASPPTLAKNARMGHPRFRYGKGRTRRSGSLGHPPGWIFNKQWVSCGGPPFPVPLR